MITLEFEPAPPSTNQLYRFKKNGQVYMTNEGEATKTAYQILAMRQYKGGLLQDELEVNVALYFADNRRRDVDNYKKILFDSLNGIVWRDDCQIFKATTEKYLGCDKSKVIIKIKKYDRIN